MDDTILIAAPKPYGAPLLAAAKVRSPRAAWFHTPSSRDPTLELPDAVVRTGATLVVLVDPDREEPATLDVLRALRARIVVWSIAGDLPFSRRMSRTMLARGRWIARAADAVAVTVPRRAALLRDRIGRAATVVSCPRDDRDPAAWSTVLRTLVAAVASDPGSS